MPTLELPTAIIEPVVDWPRTVSDWRQGIILQGARSGFPRHHAGTQNIPRKWRARWPFATAGEYRYLLDLYRITGVFGSVELDWTEPTEDVVVVVHAVSLSSIARDHEIHDVTLGLDEVF